MSLTGLDRKLCRTPPSSPSLHSALVPRGDWSTLECSTSLNGCYFYSTYITPGLQMCDLQPFHQARTTRFHRSVYWTEWSPDLEGHWCAQLGLLGRGTLAALFLPHGGNLVPSDQNDRKTEAGLPRLPHMLPGFVYFSFINSHHF